LVPFLTNETYSHWRAENWFLSSSLSIVSKIHDALGLAPVLTNEMYSHWRAENWFLSSSLSILSKMAALMKPWDWFLF
jgi:hypothetical protein